MARVYQKKAGKDYPEYGIVKGQTYYEWAFYRQKPRKSATRPNRAMLTQNDFLSEVYDAFDVDLPAIADAEDLRAVAQRVRDAGEELQSRFDDLPEGFQQGDTAQQMEERANSASEVADQIDSAADDLETELDRIAAWEAYAQREADGELGEDEDEPDGERPEGDDWDAARQEALETARSVCEEGDW
jgi:uncharacterized protein YukE